MVQNFLMEPLMTKMKRLRTCRLGRLAGWQVTILIETTTLEESVRFHLLQGPGFQFIKLNVQGPWLCSFQYLRSTMDLQDPPYVAMEASLLVQCLALAHQGE
jgi:hypothetical protein